jgi:hypothetical protein
MNHTIRFSIQRTLLRERVTIDSRCEHALAAGVIDSVDRHHDVITDLVTYEIAFPAKDFCASVDVSAITNNRRNEQ